MQGNVAGQMRGPRSLVASLMNTRASATTPEAATKRLEAPLLWLWLWCPMAERQRSAARDLGRSITPSVFASPLHRVVLKGRPSASDAATHGYYYPTQGSHQSCLTLPSRHPSPSTPAQDDPSSRTYLGAHPPTITHRAAATRCSAGSTQTGRLCAGPPQTTLSHTRLRA